MAKLTDIFTAFWRALTSGQIWNDIVSWFQNLWSWIITHPSLLGAAGALALAPAIFWLWMYERRIMMNKPHRHLMVRTFVIGMLSVFPVLIVNYVMVHFIGFDTNYFIQEHAARSAYGWVFFAFMIVAVNEELAKHFIVREVDYKRREFSRIVDGVEFSIAAALGFSFIENITYFVLALNLYGGVTKEFAQVVVFRSIGSMLAHTIFSGFYGYYYGRARFSGLRTPGERKSIIANLHKGVMLRAKRLMHLMLWHKNIHLQKDMRGKLKEEELIAEGLFVAMMLHATYNFLLQYNLVFLTLPLVLIEYLIILHELHVHRNLDLYIFSAGGTTVVSKVTEDGDLEIEDPDVADMVKRWDELGSKLAAKTGGEYEHIEWHPAENPKDQHIPKNRL